MSEAAQIRGLLSTVSSCKSRYCPVVVADILGVRRRSIDGAVGRAQGPCDARTGSVSVLNEHDKLVVGERTTSVVPRGESSWCSARVVASVARQPGAV